jgi:hypothetical protein
MATWPSLEGRRRFAAPTAICRGRFQNRSAYLATKEPVARARKRTPSIFSGCRSVLRRYRSATERFSARQTIRISLSKTRARGGAMTLKRRLGVVPEAATRRSLVRLSPSGRKAPICRARSRRVLRQQSEAKAEEQSAAKREKPTTRRRGLEGESGGRAVATTRAGGLSDSC